MNLYSMIGCNLLYQTNIIYRKRYKEGTGEKIDLLDFILQESNKLPEGQRLSHAEINSILMDILGAGHDTVCIYYFYEKN